MSNLTRILNAHIFSQVIALVIFMFISPASYANWKPNTKIDEFDRTKSTTISQSDRFGRSIGLRCDEDDSNTKLMITFDTRTVVSSPSTSVILYLKIDDNESFKFFAKMWRNSYEGGFLIVRSTDSIDNSSRESVEAIKQMIPGSTLKVRVDADNKLIDYAISLQGFTRNSNELLTNCGLVLEETKLELERQSQLPRTRPKDTDRDKLKAEYFTSIQRRIKSNWRKPPGVSDNANCTVSILQSVRGEVLKVAVEQCTGGGAALRKSLENAVRASSPLPSAPSTWLFDRRLRLRITLP